MMKQLRTQALRSVIKLSKFILAVLFVTPVAAIAQNSLTIYSNSLVNGWQNASYNVTLDYANPSPVYSSNASVSVAITSAYGGIQLYHNDMTNTAYASIGFWLNGGAAGGQHLQMYGTLDVNGSSTAQNTRYYLNTPAANTWRQYIVPL